MSAVPGSGALKKYSGSILLGFGVLALVGALVFLFIELKDLSDGVVGASLPLLAIGGVILLVLLLTAVAMIFSILGLANKDQAMGLPEGSIRAVIALSLIVLFAILSVFLYKSIYTGGRINTIVNLSDMERTQFIRDHANARDIGSAISKDTDGQPIVAKDKDGHPVKNDDGTPRYLYDVSYSSTNAASDDFAKQLLVLLGTLMTAITSFYLGAGTATSAAAATQTAISAIPPPTVSGIDPKSQSISKDGTTIHLKVTGNNLNIITHVTIVSAGVQIVGTNVASNPTQVTCDLNVANATPGVWDVVVDDGGSKSATLPGALTISA
jgi:hypothetical protein